MIQNLNMMELLISEEKSTIKGSFEALSIDGEVEKLISKYNRIWWGLDKTHTAYQDTVISFWDKIHNEQKMDKFINNYFSAVENYPPKGTLRGLWKNNIDVTISNFLKDNSFFSEKEAVLLLSSGILEATETFMKRVKLFDSSMPFEDVGQAMRNVWIMNIIQILLEVPVKCTESVFAYSMLYPYTDNFLDDTKLTREDKLLYSQRFERRLRGQNLVPLDNHEEKIFSLVSIIEKQYSRRIYPQVYESLVGIHRGQFKSIYQQNKNSSPYETDILGISFEKGGMSVLADAFLVKGTLTSFEFEFFFAYGIMLQLCDDLQDMVQDMKNNHVTIFSLTARGWKIDSIANALLKLVEYITDLIDGIGGSKSGIIKSIIRRNCQHLIFFAIAKNQEFFSCKYYKDMQEYFPYSSGYICNLNKKLLKRYKGLKPTYSGRKVEEIFMEAFKQQRVE